LSDREKQVALLARILLLDLLEAEERDWCAKHPAYLIDRMWAVSERQDDTDDTDEVFHFDVLTAAERREANGSLIEIYGEDERGWPKHLGWRAKSGGWYWQRTELLDVWLSVLRTINLKARQLGATTTACALTGHTALYQRGSSSFHYRQKEPDAEENIQLTWALMRSLPDHLWNGAQVRTPDLGRTSEPTTKIRLVWPDGRISRITGLTSAKDSGHGKRATLTVLDEFSRIDEADSIMKAVNSAAGSKGRVLTISTANGVSDPETGMGNRFHWQWVNAADKGYARKFLPWSLHPERDQEWYETSTEILELKPHEKAEQYPADEFEAFTLTNRVFFDPDDLKHYGTLVPKPLYQFDFRAKGPTTAKIDKNERGTIRVYAEPKPDGKYAIGGDVATGRGRDYSAAYVVDLGSMELVAEFHGRLDADLYAFQLHYLGRWYNTALIAVETAGGFGEAVIISLRDGRAGRPAYPMLYRHVMSSRPDLPVAKTFGFPTNTKTRPLILNQFEQAIRERQLPFVTGHLLREMQTFAHHDKGSPEIRAQDGSRDDCVMAAAITLEMYRLRGHHPDRVVPPARKSRIVGLGRGKRKNSLADIAAKYPV
jgi:hypothetical protein